MLPNFFYENLAWNKGYKLVGGMDEVGRGAFAGPVVTAVVVYKEGFNKLPPKNIKINDSKLLSDKKRREAFRWIEEYCLGYSVGVGGVAEINKKGLTKTTNSGFRRSVTGFNRKGLGRLNYLLIDAFYIPYIGGIRMPNKNGRINKKAKYNEKSVKLSSSQLAIVKGDGISFSIASASIVAKVFRDNLMMSLSKTRRNKYYLWEQNKGYGTKEHIMAIKRHGLTRHHRRDYIKFL